MPPSGRILNEDDAPGASPDAAAPATAAGSNQAASALPTEAVTAAGSAGEDEDILVLDEGMLVNAPQPFEPEPPAAEAPPFEPSRPADATAPVSAACCTTEGLLAPESAAAAASSVSSLLRTLSHERGAQVYRGGPTIEDLVREEIRPMLKAWLDEQLPPLVERLVRQEIERVAGRAGL